MFFGIGPKAAGGERAWSGGCETRVESSQQRMKGSENIREEGDSGDLLTESHVFMKFRRTESSIL